MSLFDVKPLWGPECFAHEGYVYFIYICKKYRQRFYHKIIHTLLMNLTDGGDKFSQNLKNNTIALIKTKPRQSFRI